MWDSIVFCKIHFHPFLLAFLSKLRSFGNKFSPPLSCHGNEKAYYSLRTAKHSFLYGDSWYGDKLSLQEAIGRIFFSRVIWNIFPLFLDTWYQRTYRVNFDILMIIVGKVLYTNPPSSMQHFRSNTISRPNKWHFLCISNFLPVLNSNCCLFSRIKTVSSINLMAWLGFQSSMHQWVSACWVASIISIAASLSKAGWGGRGTQTPKDCTHHQ